MGTSGENLTALASVAKLINSKRAGGIFTAEINPHSCQGPSSGLYFQDDEISAEFRQVWYLFKPDASNSLQMLTVTLNQVFIVHTAIKCSELHSASHIQKQGFLKLPSPNRDQSKWWWMSWSSHEPPTESACKMPTWKKIMVVMTWVGQRDPSGEFQMGLGWKGH